MKRTIHNMHLSNSEWLEYQDLMSIALNIMPDGDIVKSLSAKGPPPIARRGYVEGGIYVRLLSLHLKMILSGAQM